MKNWNMSSQGVETLDYVRQPDSCCRRDDNEEYTCMYMYTRINRLSRLNMD